MIYNILKITGLHIAVFVYSLYFLLSGQPELLFGGGE